MKRLTRFIAMGLFIFALSPAAFTHPGYAGGGGLITADAHFFSGMHHLLPVIAAGLVMVALLWFWRGRSNRDATFRD